MLKFEWRSIDFDRIRLTLIVFRLTSLGIRLVFEANRMLIEANRIQSNYGINRINRINQEKI